MQLKTLRLVTLLLWSLSHPAMAQAPSLSIPQLGGTPPPLPSGSSIPLPPAFPTNGAAPLPPATPGISGETPQARAAIERSIAELPTDGPQVLPLDDATEPAPAPTAPPKEIVRNLPPPLPANTNITSGRSNLPPPLPIALPSPSGRPPPLSFPSPLDSANNAPTNTGFGFAAPRAPLKSWQVKLAPSVKVKKTTFDYKRVRMPNAVYRTQYTHDNRHLPIRQTEVGYDQHYLHAIARNDIDATRAFLNAGRSVNMQNARGDNALIIAMQFGAFDVARLLIARGANPFAAGAYGLSALDYARQMQAHPVLKSISKKFGA